MGRGAMPSPDQWSLVTLPFRKHLSFTVSSSGLGCSYPLPIPWLTGSLEVVCPARMVFSPSWKWELSQANGIHSSSFSRTLCVEGLGEVVSAGFTRLGE